MFSQDALMQFCLSLTGSLVTLLGFTGIFISLIIQRRLERLQDILEQFLELPYQENINLAGRMYNLVRKYQMHYLFPTGPTRILLIYLDLTTCSLIILWLLFLFWDFRLPSGWGLALQLVPMLLGTTNLIFFRHLLKYAINPIANPLLEPIIPPPTQMRSVSFLSTYVNISVKSVLQQARLALWLPLEVNCPVILKEELSFDDFYYFLYLEGKQTESFTAFGHLALTFPPDPVTGKPVPIQRNINIPLGFWPAAEKASGPLKGELLIFPRGEKHPIHYSYVLERTPEGFLNRNFPDVRINSSVLYRSEEKGFRLLEGHDHLPRFTGFAVASSRAYMKEGKVTECTLPPYVS